MSEDRLRDLEVQVSDLRVANEGLSTSVRHLTASVDALNTTVQTLRDTMNQGRGALWLAMSAAGALGALSVVFIRRILVGDG